MSDRVVSRKIADVEAINLRRYPMRTITWKTMYVQIRSSDYHRSIGEDTRSIPLKFIRVASQMHTPKGIS